MRTETVSAIELIGAPTDVGAGERGGSMGPEALRVAGLDTALSDLGYAVVDQGNLAGPINPLAKPVDGYRHLEEVGAWCRSVREAMYESLCENRFPVLLGGDHSLAMGSISGVARYCAEEDIPLSVLWLDAHADFNTPDTTPTGNLHGMPLAVLTGNGPDALADLTPESPTLNADRIVMFGIRSVDRQERELLRENRLRAIDMRKIDESGVRVVMEEALGKLAAIGGHVHVSFDVDVLDPGIAPGVATQVAGGLTYREAQLCMEMIYDCGLMGSLDIMELNPAYDTHNGTGEVVVELMKSLFGQRILSRYHEPL